MKKIPSFLIILLITLFTNHSAASNFKPYTAEINGIEFRIDPKIELYNIIAMQFGHNGMTLSNIPYKHQSLDYFEDMKGHEASELLMQSFRNGWMVDDPIFFLLHLDENFEIKDNMPPGIIERAGGLDHLKNLSASIADYAGKSQFNDYFNNVQNNFYKQILDQTAYNFRDFKGKQMLEEFFNEQADSYTVILNLMGGYGNFGKSINNGSGFDCFAVVETNTSAGNLPLYQPSVSTTDLILHEFAHGFVNPKVDSSRDRLQTFSHLYLPIEESMKSQGYWDWHGVLNEHLVRAAVIEMIRNQEGNELAENIYYRKEMGRRFIYIDLLLKRLNSHNDSFTSFVSVLPEILAKADEEYILEKMQKVEELREPALSNIPKPWKFAKDSSTVFVVSSHEGNLNSQKLMIEFVKSYRDMFSQEIEIITDDQALKKDLSSKDIVVFGTPEGNTFLKEHIRQIPVSICKDRVITNKVIYGDDLQLVTSWASPFNEKRSFIIYTAQNAEDIQNFDKSPVKDQYHYWVARNTITLDKGDYHRYSLIWLPEIF